jgi:hypothetical protein
MDPFTKVCGVLDVPCFGECTPSPRSAARFMAETWMFLLRLRAPRGCQRRSAGHFGPLMFTSDASHRLSFRSDCSGRLLRAGQRKAAVTQTADLERCRSLVSTL